MTLDFTPLKKALTSLSEAIASTTDETFMSSLTNLAAKDNESWRDSNYFEFTYELSWKMLLRQLTLEEGREAVVALSRKDLYRLGAKKQLLDDVESWFIFSIVPEMKHRTPTMKIRPMQSIVLLCSFEYRLRRIYGKVSEAR